MRLPFLYKNKRVLKRTYTKKVLKPIDNKLKVCYY